ncbi:hypothetical protein ScPMuIL_011561 [Solemya velum]
MNSKHINTKHNVLLDSTKSSGHEDKPRIRPVAVVPKEHKAPDGGWGWFCVLGSFMAHVIIGGMERSGGVLYLELQNKYGGLSTELAWTQALRTSLRLLCGPVSSALSNRFSCRSVVIAGSLIFTLSFLISAFSPSLYFLYFSYSTVGGIGGSFTYVPSLIIVGLYFHKHRGLAVGIATAGVGIGTAFIPPLFELCFQYYGYTGTFILMASLPLQLCICGSLYRPLSTHLRLQRLRRRRKEHRPGCGSNVRLLREDPLGIDAPGQQTHAGRNRNFLIRRSNSCDSFDKKHIELLLNSKKIELEIPPKKTPIPNSEVLPTNENQPHISMNTETVKLDIEIPEKQIFLPDKVIGNCKVEDKQSVHVADHSVSVTHNAVSDVPKTPIKTPRADKNRNYKTSEAKQLCMLVLTKLNKYFEFSLLKNIRFLLFCISILLFTIAFITAYVFIPPLAKSRNISELDAAYLISIAGICDCVGRFVLSTFFDLKSIRPHRELCYLVVLLSGGMVSFLFPSMTSYQGFAVLSGLFGFMTGGYISQKSIITVDILGPKKLASSFGLVLLFQGFGTLLGPPIAGVLVDTFGSYDGTFYWCGTVVVLGGLVFMAGDIIKLYQKNSDNRTRNQAVTELMGDE